MKSENSFGWKAAAQEVGYIARDIYEVGKEIAIFTTGIVSVLVGGVSVITLGMPEIIVGCALSNNPVVQVLAGGTLAVGVIAASGYINDKVDDYSKRPLARIPRQRPNKILDC